ncbi:MAG: hypothetical protein PHW29_04385 [Flavobacterium sp.]|nr:hypothetical protein [Flavobacterium sp.]
MKYFIVNSVEIELFLLKESAKNLMEEPMKKYEELAKHLFEVEDVCSPTGQPLSADIVRNFVKLARKELEEKNKTLDTDTLLENLVLRIYNPKDVDEEGGIVKLVRPNMNKVLFWSGRKSKI